MNKLPIFLIFTMLWGFSTGDLVKVKLSSNVTVYIPKSFSPMTEEDIQQRYQSYRKPMALFTDPERLVDFGVNRSYSLWEQEDLKLLSEFYDSSILNLYDKVKFIDKGIRTVNNHEFAYFEFESTVFAENDFESGISKYTYLMYGLSGGTTYLFNFSCPRYSEASWQATAHEMMDAVRLK